MILKEFISIFICINYIEWIIDIITGKREMTPEYIKSRLLYFILFRGLWLSLLL